MAKAREELSKAETANDPEAIEAAKAAVEREQRKHLKPILGCEMYVANNSLTDRGDKHDGGRHLVVLAKNERGYKNLIKLVSKAWTEGFYKHPRTDKKELAEHREG